jgi:DNA-binding MarR family transcriptional regulator
MASHTIARPTDPQTVRTLDAVRRLVRALRTVATAVERDTGLSTAQTFVLQLLDESPANSVNELAERTATDQSSVSVVVSRLEAKGLVVRSPSPEDARRTTVAITTAGRRLLDRRPSTVQSRLVHALEQMPRESLMSLEHELTQLVALMGAAHEPASLIFEDDATSTS